MRDLENSFFHYINNTYVFGLPIDHFVHVIVCFILFVLFRVGFRLKVVWCIVLIVLIGLGKVWYSWGAMITNGRYENPPQKMFDNMLGAYFAYLLTRFLGLPRKQHLSENLHFRKPARRMFD